MESTVTPMYIRLYSGLDKKQILVDFVDLLFNVHGKHRRSCRDGQLT